MGQVVIFHHALGPTEGLERLADRIRSRGHRVWLPDLFDGARFDTIDEGVRHAESQGFEQLAHRGAAQVPEAGDLVVIGVSLGVMPAELVALTRPDVRGAILIDGAVPPAMLGGSWPAGVGLQMHVTEDDPLAVEDREVGAELAAEVDGAELRLHRGTGHLALDPSAPDHDPQVAETIGAEVAATVDGWFGITVDDSGRPEPAPTATGAELLLGYVRFLRETIAVRCSGLGDDQLRARLAPSTMSLGGMLAHLAFVEEHWMSVLGGHDRPEPWASVDWAAEPDHDWDLGDRLPGAELMAMWRRSVARTEALVASALDEGGLGQPARRAGPDGQAPNLGWILTHLIEEYGRHCGHADLIRESIDGLVGE